MMMPITTRYIRTYLGLHRQPGELPRWLGVDQQEADLLVVLHDQEIEIYYDFYLPLFQIVI